jgi:REP element-mobilizing transposase RayT
MPRANRHFLPGHVWHLTHRCHERDFLFKFARDRNRYLRWLYEARKRFGLCILNYQVTSNHIHLLVKDTEESVIARSMQLAAGRTAQDYNRRKSRLGAFWEDRYHATAIETDAHLHHCLVYIDLNMVRAGVVRHPTEWEHGGYREIQQPPDRYRLIDLATLSALCGFVNVADFQVGHRQWVDAALRMSAMTRDDRWSESVAVGSEQFVEQVKTELGSAVGRRQIATENKTYTLREPSPPYNHLFDGNNGALSQSNAYLWDTILDSTNT